MIQVGSDLLFRIDVFLGLLALAILVATFAVMAVNLVVGIACLFVIIVVVSVTRKAYLQALGDSGTAGGREE